MYQVKTLKYVLTIFTNYNLKIILFIFFQDPLYAQVNKNATHDNSLI